jgi:lysozyme family protein
MVDFDALTRASLTRWQNAKLTRKTLSDRVAKSLVDAKKRYQAVEAKTGVPWFVIAVIHERESSQNWGRSLAQGDPWNKASVHVPAGRGPFSSWEEAAIDALLNCHPYLAKRKDWSLAGVLIALEMYNGIGYASGPVDYRTGKQYPPQPSPYLWAGTNQYTSGKYIADRKFDPTHVDQQLGCVAMLLSMMAIDPTIAFPGAGKPADASKAAPAPKPAPPQASSLWASVASILSAIFKKRS